MKYLIAGLGNPGAEYTMTRHNIGFLILEELADSISANFVSGRFGLIAEGRIKNKQVILLKPDTYMNLSGKAVRHWMNSAKIPIEQILVVTDDLALPTAKLRLRAKGSDGGHNGLKSIDAELNSQAYARLRFGVGNEFQKGKQVDYVLGSWDKEEWPLVKEKIITSAEAIKSFVLEGAGPAMTKFNQ